MPQPSPIYGPIAKAVLPKQDGEKSRLLAERFLRAQQAHGIWSKPAKDCVDFVEGRQWTETQLKKLEEEGRPALVFNKIAPLVRLMLGYHRNNRMDTSFLPGNDELSSLQSAQALTALKKQDAEISQLRYVDTEVFMDGIVTGRGYYDSRLDFSENDFGQLKDKALDPFSTYLDPDADEYDLSEGCNYVQTSRWTSLDEIEGTYGSEAGKLLGSLVQNDGYTQFPQSYYYHADETTPVRKFGFEDAENAEWVSLFHDRWVDFIDPMRKNIRTIDTQHWVKKIKPVIIDLETGDRAVVPDHWTQKDYEKAAYHAERERNPIMFARRPVRRVRWTVMVGDLIVYDQWSPYDHFTITGFFPYFRRGQTRGMVDDLLDPQREVNKRRSSIIDIVGRTTNSGWLHHEDALDPDQEENLDKFGASPGQRLKWKGEAFQKPERINPSPPPMSMERLEKKATEDLHEISGINKDALGQLDRVQSGRAIEARQRQAVIGFQMYMDNLSRTKELQARKWLKNAQTHYTEHRIIRVLGENGQTSETFVNQPVVDDTGVLVKKLNDITLGKYTVAVDEVPMSASFKNAQFEEAMEILEKLAPVIGSAAGSFADVIVDMSSMPQKEEIKGRLRAAMGLEDSTALASGTVPTPGAIPGESVTDNVVPFQG